MSNFWVFFLTCLAAVLMGTFISALKYMRSFQGNKVPLIGFFTIERLYKNLPPTEATFPFYMTTSKGLVLVTGVYTARFDGRNVLVFEHREE